ncbi:hypothetical protein LCGC14_2828290 [marine sediment metagenome]|uniref:non-specific serine/threonine protein kinase n=1 Tax=marine sediment metagenome TaxID=412755 RepID=A0A0F9B600_9ZZZZ
MKLKTIFHGAEAIILKDKNNVIKKRVRKSYRIPELDERIRKLRTRRETRLLEKASEEIPVPKIIKSDEKSKKIIMDFIDGKKISDNLDNFSEKKQLEIFKQIGENISKLHDSSIIHGDLTTSNMILNEKENKVYFIDFGLGFRSYKIEDKAVDLHLLKQALEAKHFKNSEKLFEEVIKGYSISKDCQQVFERFKKVESRGRYKDKY